MYSVTPLSFFSFFLSSSSVSLCLPGGKHFSLGAKGAESKNQPLGKQGGSGGGRNGRESYRGSCSAGSGAPNRLLLPDDDGTGSDWIELCELGCCCCCWR
ncbi:hypothetical protein BZA05DRAFT_258713 [Tricharina praecox]|uniref:uncharacterized protein n=1 Tax=Tricharina praecox TaxID=43433 RepID=UPI00221F9638|nr:uncharacterized protein BZA05DRAFT_258713 [Tricharina praecox]KAI5854131.1 hypothetical protein BZA05DRAFT_258713 [Tricharina praecox]